MSGDSVGGGGSEESMGSGDSEGAGSKSVGTLRILSVKRLGNGRARVRAKVSTAGSIWIRGTGSVTPRRRGVSGPSRVNLTVASRGKARRQLIRTSRTRVRVTIGYTPTEGQTRFRNRWITLISR